MSANMDTDQLIEWLKKKGVKQSILDKLKGDFILVYVNHCLSLHSLLTMPHSLRTVCIPDTVQYMYNCVSLS